MKPLIKAEIRLALAYLESRERALITDLSIAKRRLEDVKRKIDALEAKK